MHRGSEGLERAQEPAGGLTMDAPFFYLVRFWVDPKGLDQVVVAGKTLPQAVRYIAAICAGKVTGAGSGLEIFSDFSGAQAVEVFVDSSGNRTNVVLN